VTNSPKVAKK